MKDFNRNVILSSMSWRFLERCGAQAVGFVVSLILARLLMPEDYGVIALVMVFTDILAVFIDSGMSVALVQKKDADDLDFSSFFYFNMLSCAVLYLIAFAAAPLIAAFYEKPELTAVVRVLSLTLIISGVKSVQTAYISKNLQFKKFFYATLAGTIGAAVVGIAMAYRGYGVWALVAQTLFNNTVDTIILWIAVDWRPKRCFSLRRIKCLFDYGWKLLAASLLDTVYGRLRSLIIGKVYSSQDLAYYNRGNHLPQMIVTNINTSISGVLVPAMSREQSNREQIKKMTRRAMTISVYVMAPLLIGMAVCAEPIVKVLLTEKWLPCVPFLRIFCITYIFYPVHTANLSAIKALGRSDLFLKLEIYKKAVGLVALMITVPISVMAMGYSLLFNSIASQLINSWPNKKLLNYSYLEQVKDILPGILMSIAMGCCIYPIQWLGLPDIVTLLIQVPLGAVIYVAGSIVFKLESFQYLWSIVQPIVARLKK